MPTAQPPADPPPPGPGEPPLDELLARYLPKLHAFVQVRLGAGLRRRESTQDVVQSVCRELVAQGEAFEFRGEERFRAWLYVTARNKIREKQRRHGAQRRDLQREAVVDDGGLADAASLLTPSAEAVGQETAALVRAALEALDAEHREVITMARILGLPHAVIAEFLDRSEPAVRQLLARAMVRLAEELRRRGVELPAR